MSVSSPGQNSSHLGTDTPAAQEEKQRLDSRGMSVIRKGYFWASNMATQQQEFSIIGNSVHRVDGVEKVTVKAKYTGDLLIPEMIERRMLRSLYAHARIRSIDTREAEAVPRVVAVVTSKDFVDISPYIGRGKNKDQPIIAVDRAIFTGQPVAAVAALDR